MMRLSPSALSAPQYIGKPEPFLATRVYLVLESCRMKAKLPYSEQTQLALLISNEVLSLKVQVKFGEINLKQDNTSAAASHV